jgi:hypothetical protein
VLAKRRIRSLLYGQNNGFHRITYRGRRNITQTHRKRTYARVYPLTPRSDSTTPWTLTEPSISGQAPLDASGRSVLFTKAVIYTDELLKTQNAASRKTDYAAILVLAVCPCLGMGHVAVATQCHVCAPRKWIRPTRTFTCTTYVSQSWF